MKHELRLVLRQMGKRLSDKQLAAVLQVSQNG
jgi:uncharacterized protein YneF (UPF0154 family)